MGEMFNRVVHDPMWAHSQALFRGENPLQAMALQQRAQLIEARRKALESVTEKEHRVQSIVSSQGGRLTPEVVTNLMKVDFDRGMKLKKMFDLQRQAEQERSLYELLARGDMGDGMGSDMAPYVMAQSENPVLAAIGQQGVEVAQEQRKIDRDIAKEKRAPNQTQSNSFAFGQRMVNAEQNLAGGLESVLASGMEAAKRRLPGGNYMVSDDYQLAFQAASDWVTANLRKESGATIPPDELAQEVAKYFPQPGDSDKVIAQKRRSRVTAMKGMRKAAGALGDDIPAYPGEASGGGVEYADGTLAQNADGQRIILKNGQWVAYE